MQIPNDIRFQLNTMRLIWLLLCACFIQASVVLPAFSAQNMLPDTAMSTDMLINVPGTAGKAAQGKLKPMHHAEGSMRSPCGEPGCEQLSNCSDKCTMNTCCNAPFISNTLPQRVQTDIRKAAEHRYRHADTVISRRSEPLYRPPIL